MLKFEATKKTGSFYPLLIFTCKKRSPNVSTFSKHSFERKTTTKGIDDKP